MRWTGDVERGAWLVARLGRWASVGGVVGDGWEAYARVLHPMGAVRTEYRDDDPAEHPRDPWTWSEVARRLRVPLTPLTSSTVLLGEDEHGEDEHGRDLPDGWSVEPPVQGGLEPRLLAALTSSLRAATTTPDAVTVGVWSGWGALNRDFVFAGVGYLGELPSAEQRAADLREAEAGRLEQFELDVSSEVSAAIQGGPLLEAPWREYVLLTGSVAELADPDWGFDARIGWRRSVWGATRWPMPQLIWPADRAWVVASEIDWDSTIVGGSRALVDAVLADERFEAFDVHPDDVPAAGPSGSGMG
ncbi:hypothetical protein [Curtobacterium sp. MCBD17_028]|uniref:hypothetical protein n=1 Tax=Curtobacterium sp. MCBD17_028 TaxID=2175670 RepID=UPI000DA7F709|nr:hypothetical protein [Curtobacterium sp. MCBD17_028]PZE24567.1 hypothetical protein DEI86_12375 [Curtobacterium sp. MCBD17_028]